VLFLNPKLWNMQFPLSLEMRSQGIPIDSLTVAAGVPSLEKANEILAGIRSVGMTYIAFKPGSVGAIRQVLQIAENNLDITIVIQWTGGRAGRLFISDKLRTNSE
jgi:enoyl reductase-like protein